MKNGELIDLFGSKVELHEHEEGYEIRTPSYSLLFHTHSPYIDLFDPQGNRWMDMFKGSRINTTVNHDVTYDFQPPRYTELKDGAIEVRIVSENEADVFKEQVWICRDTFIETYIQIQSEGTLQNVELLSGLHIHPNMFGESMSQRYFKSVYNPQPSEEERPAISAFESTQITTSGMWKPGRRREFLITPFSYGFNMSAPQPNTALPDGTWLMASISAPIEEQNMVDYTYKAKEDGFSLNLTYDSTSFNAPFTSPSLLLHFAPDPYTGLKDFKRHAAEISHLNETAAITIPDWHHGSTFVSWGRQLEFEHRQTEMGKTASAKDFISEQFVLEALDTFENYDVPIDKITLDDKWQAEYGTNTPDIHKWPDMARFTKIQHELGRHILLWLKLFDPEGLPAELCILDAKGRPIASDPTNPEYLELLRQQIHTMLSPDQLDADGLKLDFLAQLPHGPGLRWHGNKRGHAALHDVMKTIYDQAVTTKPDSLIEAQVVSPWFANTFNRIRLNDTNDRHSVIMTMGARAQLARTLLPLHPIDPDGWPMPDKKSWLNYVRVQPYMSKTVTTHFVESVNGEPLTSEDFSVLAQAIRKTKE